MITPKEKEQSIFDSHMVIIVMLTDLRFQVDQLYTITNKARYKIILSILEEVHHALNAIMFEDSSEEK